MLPALSFSIRNTFNRYFKCYNLLDSQLLYHKISLKSLHQDTKKDEKIPSKTGGNRVFTRTAPNN